jgi:hypothetical protein
MFSSHIHDPEHWRGRAKEARALADKMNDPISKDMMLQIAKDYERLAERAQARTTGHSTKPMT